MQKENEYVAAFLSVNRSKKSICLDLKTDHDKQILWKLIRMLLEADTQSVLQKLGYTTEED